MVSSPIVLIIGSLRFWSLGFLFQHKRLNSGHRLLHVSDSVGWRRFSEDIELMLGFKPNYYWIGTWTVLAPVFIVVSV